MQSSEISCYDKIANYSEINYESDECFTCKNDHISSHNLNISEDEIFYNELSEKLNKLKSEEIELLKRITGITQYVLKEQLADEYTDLSNNILITEQQLTQFNQMLLDKIFSEMYNDLFTYYSLQFKKNNNLITSIELTNNTSIQSNILANRLRIPKDITDRRTLIILLNFLNCSLVVKNLENITLDIIGNYSYPKLNLYLFTISKDINEFTNDYGVPVHILI